jgi:putative membrane protein
MHKLMLLAISASVAIASLPVAAQEPASRGTREFVEAAAQSDSFEIMEALTVLAQSTDPQVRALATAIIEAHTATSDALRAAAVRAGLAPPPKTMSTDQAQLLGALQSLRGPAFDEVYVRHQALAHRSALVTEQRYAADGDQPELRVAAASAVPIITSHLSMAEQMRARNGR